MSEGEFICGDCDERFPNEEEMRNHISISHVTGGNESVNSESAAGAHETSDVDENTMFNSEDDKDLNEAFDELYKDIASQEEALESVMMQQRLERFKVLIKKKTNFQKESNLQVANYKQIEKHLYSEIKKKEKEINDLKKAATKDRNERGELIKANNNLKASLKEKADLVTHLEEQIRPDDDVEEVENFSQNPQPMNKTTTGHTCSACEKTFGSNRALEKHMDDKHQEAECPFCDKTFQGKQGLKRHVNICIENGTTREKCTHCNKFFTTFGLKRHTDQCTSKKETCICKVCEQICKTPWELKKHMKEEHTKQQDVSREVCKHYRRGYCRNGDQCLWSHVGFQQKDTRPTSRPTTDNWTPACRHGENCSWMAKGSCRFFHRGVGVQQPGKQHHKGNKHNTGGRQCRFGSRCDRKDTCPNSHGSVKGFPQNQRGNHQMRNGRSQ